MVDMALTKDNKLIWTVLLGLAIGMVVAIVGGGLIGAGLWLLGSVLFAAGLTVLAATTGLTLYRTTNDVEAVVRHFNVLTSLNPRDIQSDNTSGKIPPIAESNPLAQVAARVRQCLYEQCHQIQDLEHARTAAEIRCRRATEKVEQIKRIFAELGDPIIAIDGFDELLLTNHSAQQLFHFDDDSLEHRLLQEVVDCQQLANLLTATSQRKTTAARTEELELTDPNGNKRWFRVTASKLTGDEPGEEDSGNTGAVAVLRDIGDQKALQKRNAEFVSSVSHEMKTPLAGIKAYVELLVDGDAEDEETKEEFLGVINSQADRLKRLVDNLLNLSRIEAGVVKVSKKPQSLNELLEEAIHVVQPAAEAKNIALKSDLSPMYLGVLADRDMLSQAAINLLSNAIKYTPNDGQVTLRSRTEDNQVRFEVEDTGVGLSEDDSQKVFEKFYRVKKDKTMAAGTGLGLPLAKHIVEDVHGGSLTVKSKLGEGSTFTITLPSAGQLTHT